MSGYRAAFFAFALIWAINAAFGSPLGFLSIYAVLVVAFGFAFAGRVGVPGVLAGVFCFLPGLLSLLANRPLVVFSRKGSHPAR